MIASGFSGLDREIHGALRHQVLGMRVLLADGQVAQVGGRLVKNVTGFDIPRLFTGSRGTLGIILEASLRTRHIPAAQEQRLLHDGPIQEAETLIQNLRAATHSLHHLPVAPGCERALHRSSPKALAAWAHCATVIGPLRLFAIPSNEPPATQSHPPRGLPSSGSPCLQITCAPGDWPQLAQALNQGLG